MPFEIKQSSLEEIIETEDRLARSARERHGPVYVNALGCSVLLSRCIEEYAEGLDIFGRFFSQMKKQQLLALLSAVRLHHVQAMMNLRQVLEAGSSAAFAIANPEQGHFANVDENGLLDASQTLAGARYKWLDAQFPEPSAWIKEQKEKLNNSTSHANIVSSHRIYLTDGKTANLPTFDYQDEYLVGIDLWLIGRTAIVLMDLLYGVSLRWKRVGFCAEFVESFKHFDSQNSAILREFQLSDRYINAMKKFATSEKRPSQLP